MTVVTAALFSSTDTAAVSPLPEGMIETAEGAPVWNPQKYDFIEGEAPDTVNPSLWRQSELNAVGGLFEVVEGIYQVRNMDLSNMTIIEGAEGIGEVVRAVHPGEGPTPGMGVVFIELTSVSRQLVEKILVRR